MMNSRNEIKDRIKKLTETINRLNYEYYVLDQPSLSDAAYDDKVKELIDLETSYPELLLPTSPTQRVSGDVATGFEPVLHGTPVLSLANVFNKNDILNFHHRVQTLSNNETPEYIVEAKIDGLSVVIRYENGQYAQAATRGDGVQGEDVTNNVKTIGAVPLQLNETVSVTVRGEVFIDKKTFQALNDQREANNEPLFVNARNAAAGSLRQLNPLVTASRKLNIFIFNIEQYEQKKQLKTHSESFEFLKSLGFKTNNILLKTKDINKVVKLCEDWNDQRTQLSFDIDGLVIKVNDFKLRERLGFTGKSPRWATAYKFPAEHKETRVKDITIQVGRSGALTPIAELEAVFVAGSTVSRVTLHNADFIKEKDIRIGDMVVIRKAGDVIPEIVSVNLSYRTSNQAPFVMPSQCPVCGSDVKSLEGEVAIKCTNSQCPAQIERLIIHFASRNAMNIDGLGPSIIKALIDHQLIKNVSDLYYITFEEVINLERFGEKSANNLLNAIDQSRRTTLQRLITGLGIDFVGTNIAAILAKNFNTIDDVIASDYNTLIGIDEIGEKIAQSIKDYFAKETNIALIQRLFDGGVVVSNEQATTKMSLLGKTFVITGTLPTLSRKEAKQMIESMGGKATTSVSKNTDYLVAGDKAGSKLEKAEQLMIKIIDENQLKEMCH